MSEQKTTSNQIISEFGGVRHNKLWRNNIILLIALFVLIFIAPLLDHLSTFIANTALTVVVISGVFAAEYRKKVFRVLLILGLLVLFSMTLSFILPDIIPLKILPFLLATCSLIFSSIALVAHVSQAQRVEKSMVLCAINSYLMMGLTASVVFLLLDFAVPESFPVMQAGVHSLSQFIYFGFVTLSTLGYGDITPAAPFARSFAIFTALGGQLYLVIVMALIIGKFVNSSSQK